MIRSRFLAAAMALTMSGCASTATMQRLKALEDTCAHGGQAACEQVPMVAQQADAEREANRQAVAVGILAALAGAAAGIEASQPRYVIVRRCRGFWC